MAEESFSRESQKTEVSVKPSCSSRMDFFPPGKGNNRANEDCYQHLFPFMTNSCAASKRGQI